MRCAFRRCLCATAFVLIAGSLYGQDLDPRAYLNVPVGTNIAVAAYSRIWGDVLLDPSLPLDDVTTAIDGYALGYFRGINFFGRSANFRLAFPYARGTVQGTVLGDFLSVYRSGIGDLRGQLSVNLLGAPAMTRQEFARYRPKTNLFASFTFLAPTGQYSPSKLVNVGNNRWALKPELAATQQLGKFTLEGYAGVWFFTTNDEFYKGTSVRSQNPMFTGQVHVTYTFRPGLWAGADATFYSGGRTTLDGVDKDDRQNASRVGVVGSWAFAPRMAFKAQYTRTTTIRIGGKFDLLSFAYTYQWFDK